jgi:hypothetical protein
MILIPLVTFWALEKIHRRGAENAENTRRERILFCLGELQNRLIPLLV